MLDKKDRIQKFNSIRDIPYRLPVTKKELKEQDYTCMGKNKMLFDAFKDYYPVRFRFCEFFWNEQNLPHDIFAKFNKELKDHHCYLELFLNNRWITLDASIDSGVKAIINVNEWDGENDTSISIHYRRIIPYNCPQHQQIEQEKFDIEKRWNDIKNNCEFCKEVNHLYEQAYLLDSNNFH